jgi:protein-tyrosine phosphatase
MDIKVKQKEMDAIYRIRQLLKPMKRMFIDRWWQVRGTTIANPPLPGAVSSIVFICKGNICRSAFAHYLTNEILTQNSRSMALWIGSAGLEAHKGTKSPEMAIEVAKDFGINMEGHRSVLLDDDLVDSSDMLVAMEPKQVRVMQEKYPHKRDHFFLMPLFEKGWEKSYFGWQKYHLQDPYGKGRVAFFECFDRVQKCVHGLMAALKKR